MNDLTKEARRRELEEATRRQQLYHPMDLTGYRGYSAGLSQSNIDRSFGRQKYGNDYLEPDRPLTGKPEHYLTGLEGSRCDHIKDHAAFSFKYMMLGKIEESRTGINPDKINRVSDEYRKISDEVDNETGE